MSVRVSGTMRTGRDSALTWTGCPDADGLRNFTVYFLIPFRFYQLAAQKKETSSGKRM